MSFGYGVGDFLAIGTIVCKVYNSYKDAPEQFRSISEEILGLHIVVERVADQLRPELRQGQSSSSKLNCKVLGDEEVKDLKILHGGLQALMKELDDLLEKYKKMEAASGFGKTMDRLKWGKEDIAGFRERLHSHTSLLTAFNTTLLTSQRGPLANQSSQLALQNTQLTAIQHRLDMLFRAAGGNSNRLQRRGSVASLRSIASFACSLHGKPEWKELSRELQASGVTGDLMNQKKDQILAIFREMATEPTATENTTPNQADEKETLPSDLNSNSKQKRPRNRPRFRSIDWPSLDFLTGPLLISAAAEGDLAAVKLRLRFVGDVNWKEDAFRGGITALDAALQARHCNWIVVKLLLQKGAVLTLNVADPRNNQAGSAKTSTFLYPLHAVAGNSNANEQYTEQRYADTDLRDVAKLMVERGVDVNRQDAEGWTALQTAAFHGNLSVVEVLLDNGADININSVRMTRTSKDGRQESWSATALELVGEQLGLRRYRTRLVDIIEFLLKRNGRLATTNPRGETTLHWTVRMGLVTGTQILLKSITGKGIAGMERDIDAKDMEANRSPLHIAAICGNLQIAKLLLDHGAKIDDSDNLGANPLNLAASEGHIEVVKLLLSQPGVRINHQDIDGKCSTQVATIKGHTEVVQSLLNHGARINVKDENNNSLLHIACATAPEKLDLVKMLFQRLQSTGDDIHEFVNRRGHNGWTAVQMAAKRGYTETIHELLNRGARLDGRSASNNTTLHLAVCQRPRPIMPGCTEPVLELLLRKGLVPDLRGWQGNTALHDSAFYSSLGFVKVFLDNGADVNGTNDAGDSILNHALSSDGESGQKIATVKLLLERGAKTDKVNKRGETALEVAMKNVNSKDGRGVVELLQEQQNNATTED